LAKTGILSPNPGNTTQIIVKQKGKLVKSDDRSSEAKDIPYEAAVEREFSGESEEDSAMKNCYSKKEWNFF
jgi:hypothetical protein